MSATQARSSHQVLEAALTAARWHKDQQRNGGAEEPYINHRLEVASLLSKATDGKDTNLIIAALLHDAIEDQLCDHRRSIRR